MVMAGTEIISMVRTATILEITLKNGFRFRKLSSENIFYNFSIQCSPWTSSSSTWELIRNEVSLAPPHVF